MIILDIEASGLSDQSYPIEIAWIDRRYPKRRDSFLIRPCEGWVHWDFNAEKLHGIHRQELQEYGLEVRDAVYRLEKALEGEAIYVHPVEYDRFWMMRLFRAAGRDELCFHFRHLESLLPPSKVSPFFERLQTTDTRHRALDDVEKLIKALDYFAPL